MKKFFQFIIIFLVITGWIFSGWPQISGFPPKVQEAWAATATTTYSFLSNSQSWSNTACGQAPGASCAWASGDGSPAAGSLEENETRKNKSGAWTWQLSGITWESLGVPKGSTITDVDGSYNHIMATCTTCGTTNTSGDLLIRNSGDTATIATLETAVTYSAATSWAPRDALGAQSVGASYQSSNTGIILRITGTLSTPNTTGAVATLRQDEIALTITYTMPTFEQSGYRFFANMDTADVGTPLAALNATSTLSSTGAAFRLRMLLHVSTIQLGISGDDFKLQFAGAGADGNCASPGGTPSWYTDVTATTTIAFNNNTPADGDNLTFNSEDPTHAPDTIVDQDYEELNDFTNSVAAIPAGQDGKWDFALVDNGAPASTAYCFRVVRSDYTVLNTYTVYPAVITSVAASLTFTIDTDNVSFVSAITPGTPVSTSSVLTVNTNNSAGYNITINRASTTPTLFVFSDNATTTIADTPNGNNWTSPGASATTTAGPSAVWTDGTTKGLGFRTKQTGTNSGAYHSAWWGTSDAGANALYSGISTSTAAQLFSQNNVGTGSNENITVEYRIDVLSNQRSGTYISSPVIYTATVNP